MIENVSYETSADIDPAELSAFYEQQKHATTRDAARLERMIAQTYCFVTARLAGEIIGIARGVTDGVHGRLAECKLDPRFQGPACITRIDGRIEHDADGVAKEMALRVVESLREYGVDKIEVLAYGTEVDFCEDLGFKRVSGMVALEMAIDSSVRVTANAATS
jgi:hypothetical protein